MSKYINSIFIRLNWYCSHIHQSKRSNNSGRYTGTGPRKFEIDDRVSSWPSANFPHFDRGHPYFQDLQNFFYRYSCRISRFRCQFKMKLNTHLCNVLGVSYNVIPYLCTNCNLDPKWQSRVQASFQVSESNKFYSQVPKF